MTALPIYTPKTSNRLIYVLDWLFGEQLKTGYRLIHNREEASAEKILISYGAILPNALNIPDAGLLWQINIEAPEVKKGNWEEVSTLFDSDDYNYTLSFDLFSAIFFLLSRYEEYFGFTPDKHGRYPATDSILFREGLLEEPVVDEWVEKFRKLLSTKYSLITDTPFFSFHPSYDIDIAWSYKYKGMYRTLGAIAKSLVSGKIAAVSQRLNVLSGNQQDPYDNFDWLQQLHRQFSLSPDYYVLASLRTTPFDKNIYPKHPKMKELLCSLSAEGSVGIHPSYYSNTQQHLQEEKNCLEEITGKKITASRQHYIKLKFPDTYRSLISAGIIDDHSMGYGTHLGFRAGTGRSFYWFDLQANEQSTLRVHPFCFMDTTAHFDCRLSVQAAFERLDDLAKRLKDCNSRLTTIFHNFSLGADKDWAGWKDAYANFVRKVIS